MWIKQNWSIIIPSMHVWGAARKRRSEKFVSPGYLDASSIYKNVYITIRVQTFMVKGIRGAGREWHATCVWIINYIFYFISTFIPSTSFHENTKTRLVCHDTTFILFQSIDRNVA